MLPNKGVVRHCRKEKHPRDVSQWGFANPHICSGNAGPKKRSSPSLHPMPLTFGGCGGCAGSAPVTDTRRLEPPQGALAALPGAMRSEKASAGVWHHEGPGCAGLVAGCNPAIVVAVWPRRGNSKNGPGMIATRRAAVRFADFFPPRVSSERQNPQVVMKWGIGSWEGFFEAIRRAIERVQNSPRAQDGHETVQCSPALQLACGKILPFCSVQLVVLDKLNIQLLGFPSAVSAYKVHGLCSSWQLWLLPMKEFAKCKMACAHSDDFPLTITSSVRK